MSKTNENDNENEKEKDMKATELMIGDWVTFVNGNGERIADSQIDINSLYTAMNAPEILQFEPIPLTWDILYKNFPDTDDGLAWWENTEFENDAKDEYLWWHITVTGDVLVVNGEIRYVHELQHALRLCGIEKEIEL